MEPSLLTVNNQNITSSGTSALLFASSLKPYLLLNGLSYSMPSLNQYLPHYLGKPSSEQRRVGGLLRHARQHTLAHGSTCFTRRHRAPPPTTQRQATPPKQAKPNTICRSRTIWQLLSSFQIAAHLLQARHVPRLLPAPARCWAGTSRRHQIFTGQFSIVLG